MPTPSDTPARARRRRSAPQIAEQAVGDVVDPAVHDSSCPRRQASCTMVVWQTLRTCSITFSSQSRSIAASSSGSASNASAWRSRTSWTWRSQLSIRPSDAAMRRPHAAAAVVAADDDVLDLQHVDGVLQHRQAVQVGVHDDVGDVAVDEQLARQQADDLVGRHAAVGAADPQVARRLLARVSKNSGSRWWMRWAHRLFSKGVTGLACDRTCTKTPEICIDDRFGRRYRFLKPNETESHLGWHLKKPARCVNTGRAAEPQVWTDRIHTTGA